MLHEEVRSGMTSMEEDSPEGELGESTARRYSFEAQSVSYAVASQLLPHRLLALWGLFVAGVALLAGLTYLEMRAEAVCQSLGLAELPAAKWSTAGSIGSWFSNACLWIATLLCLLMYGLRRHRLDDYRGSYRRWLGAAGAFAVANFLSSTGLHHTMAEALAATSGFSALPNHAVWWLVPAAIVGTWVVVRMALDMRPCRLGLFCLAMACGFYVTALATSFVVMPTLVDDLVSAPAAVSAGHLWLVVALLAQIRFLLLEASGQIAIPRAGEAVVERVISTGAKSGKVIDNAETEQQGAVAARGSRSSVNSPPKPEPIPPAKKSLIAAAKGQTEWIDGRDSRDGERDSDDDRSLSKAERKRLRREQARRRAA